MGGQVRLASLLCCLAACAGQNPPLAEVWPVQQGNLAASTFVLNNGSLGVVADDRGRTIVTAAQVCAHPVSIAGTPLVVRVVAHRACLLQAPREMGLGVIWHDPTENPGVYGSDLTTRRVLTFGFLPPPLGAPIYRGDGALGLVGGVTALDVRTVLAEQGLHAQSLHQGELQYDPGEEHEERETGMGECDGNPPC